MYRIKQLRDAKAATAKPASEQKHKSVVSETMDVPVSLHTPPSPFLCHVVAIHAALFSLAEKEGEEKKETYDSCTTRA